jgi:hydroxyacylglutathione hydrolase
LETLARVTDVVFDKTGTLTRGQLNVEQVLLHADADETECRALAAALEQGSRHPLALALLAGQVPASVVASRHHVGSGVEGKVKGRELRLGAADWLARQGHRVSTLLLTHGHIDHIWSAQKVSDTYGCPVFIHPADRFMLTDPIKGFGPRLGQLALGALFREPRQVVELDRDGDALDLGGLRVTVDHTPGHTRGSVTFRVSHDAHDVVFTGDTLFRQSVGRTDLPGGSGRDLLGSILTKLLVLDDNTRVLPGHGEPSSIGAERRTNPFLQGLRL